MLEGVSRLLCDDPPHELPQEGKIRCVLCVCVCVCVCVCGASHRCFAVEPGRLEEGGERRMFSLCEKRVSPE